MIIRRRRQVDDDDVLGADIVLGVPDMRRNIDQAPVVLGHRDLADVAIGRRVRARIEQDELHLSQQDEIAVLVSLVQAPAFDIAGADGEAVQRTDRGRMPAPPLVENFDEAAALVAVGWRVADRYTLDQPSQRGALRGHGLHIAGRGRECPIEDGAGRQPSRFAAAAQCTHPL